MISAKAPGKLYIAGEYAVVETGFPAIIVAVDQFVITTIEESTEFGSIISDQYSENSIYWRRQGNKMVFDNRDNPFHYILEAIHIAEEYATSQGKKLKTYHLRVDSQLDSEDGKKYGLGSSAAVTVATIKALCAFYELPLDREAIFKLSAITHLKVQGNGSLGDIAASVYTGWIAYHSFDRTWLQKQLPTVNIADLINQQWPGLSIQSLTPPANLRLIIGWTGSPASTSKLVDKVTMTKAHEQTEYQEFLNDSKECLNQMISGFFEKNLVTIQAQIRKNRLLLKKLTAFSGVQIETPRLTKLCEFAEHFGGAAKTSGAGGGDCGIVVIDQAIDCAPLLKKWRRNDIVTLPLKVYEN